MGEDKKSAVVIYTAKIEKVRSGVGHIMSGASAGTMRDYVQSEKHYGPSEVLFASMGKSSVTEFIKGRDLVLKLPDASERHYSAEELKAAGDKLAKAAHGHDNENRAGFGTFRIVEQLITDINEGKPAFTPNAIADVLIAKDKGVSVKLSNVESHGSPSFARATTGKAADNSRL